MLTGIVLALTALTLIGAVCRMILRYRASTGTAWEKLLATAKGSATVLWSYVVIVGGAALSWLDNVADVLNQPQVTDILQRYLTPSKVGVAVTVIGIITLIARLRSLVKA